RTCPGSSWHSAIFAEIGNPRLLHVSAKLYPAIDISDFSFGQTIYSLAPEGTTERCASAYCSCDGLEPNRFFWRSASATLWIAHARLLVRDFTRTGGFLGGSEMQISRCRSGQRVTASWVASGSSRGSPVA